jgi:hypothetical protein
MSKFDEYIKKNKKPQPIYQAQQVTPGGSAVDKYLTKKTPTPETFEGNYFSNPKNTNKQ